MLRWRRLISISAAIFYFQPFIFLVNSTEAELLKKTARFEYDMERRTSYTCLIKSRNT